MKKPQQASAPPEEAEAAATTLAEKAYLILIEEIVSLEIPPGTLLSEWGLSKRLGFGRTPIREAIKRLTHDELVRLVPRRGIVTTDLSASGMLLMLEPRRALEPLRYARAAARIDAPARAELAAIADVLERAAATLDVRAHSAADREFDDLVDHWAANPYLTTAVAHLHNHVRRYWNAQVDGGGFSRIAKLHAEMVRAVGSGRPEVAAAACNAMLDYNERFLRESLAGSAAVGPALAVPSPRRRARGTAPARNGPAIV